MFNHAIILLLARSAKLTVFYCHSHINQNDIIFKTGKQSHH